MKQETLFRPERKPQITTDPSQLSNSIAALPRPPGPAHSLITHSLAGSLVHSLTPRWMIVVLAWLECGLMINMQSAAGAGGDDGRGAGGGVTGEREEPINQASSTSFCGLQYR